MILTQHDYIILGIGTLLGLFIGLVASYIFRHRKKHSLDEMKGLVMESNDDLRRGAFKLIKLHKILGEIERA